MTENTQDYTLLMLILSGVILISVPLRATLRRLALPGVIAFIGLGLLLSVGNHQANFISSDLSRQIETFAQIGIVALLFRVGLESNLDALFGQLRRAALIWVPDITVSAALVFGLVWLWPGYGFIPALIAAIAASATSVGVSVAAWEERDMIDTEEGALLLDVAELDDLSAVILLSVIFVIVPQLQGGPGNVDWSNLVQIGLIQVLKILGFCAICYAFSRFAERTFSRLFAALDAGIGPFVFATGSVFLIAALADALGFSLAIGALFAGLAFSRDPAERRIDEAFRYILAVFGPFFFVSIGLSVSINGIAAALPLAVALLAALLLGKMIGAGLPAAAISGKHTGLLIGVSMIPRAEIYLIVMLGGLTLGDWAVPQPLYTSAVLASIGTCLIGPILVLRSLPNSNQKEQRK